MPLADLLEVLRLDADARATALVAASREEADRMVAAADRRLASRLADAITLREAELRAKAAGEVEAARRAATRDVLRARAAALATVFGRARAVLEQRAAMPGLRGHWAEAEIEARSYIPSGDAVMRRPPEVAGITLEAADRSMGIDSTVGALLTRLEPELAIAIARELEVEP
jgi:vacuolar-type H+-ATPase subunit E/Vma4